MSKKVKVKIDGREFEVDSELSILQAARQNGIYIPAICYSDRFGAIGACRICAVEIAGMKKPMLSCAGKVKDGMEVTTNSSALDALRREIIYEWDTFHPLQCGVCDKSGECDLQNINYEFNISENPKEAQTDPLTIPQGTIHYEWKIIHHDANLCIQCRRCVAVCDKVVNFGILALVKKDGDRREIDTKDGKPLDCEFCGQCVSVCPTGAMSSKLFKYKARAWEMEKIPTTCGFCSSGCQMDLNVKNNEILRVTSEESTPNMANLCNLGRFNYSASSSDRLIKEYSMDSKTLNQESVISELSQILKSTPKEKVFGISGARETQEDNLAFKMFFNNTLSNNNIDSLSSTHIGKLYKYLPQSVNGFYDFSEISDSDLIICFGGDIANEMPRIDWAITRGVKLLKTSKVVSAYWKDTKIDTLGSMPLRYEPGKELDFLTSFAYALKSEGFGAGLDGLEDLKESSFDVSSIIEEVKKASKIAFIVCEEALERDFGEEIAKAVSNVALLLKDKVKVYASSKYNNAFGALYNGYGLSSDFSVNKLLEFAKAGKIETLLLLNADLYSFLSDSDAEIVRANVKNIVLFDTFESKTSISANVVIPVPFFTHQNGSFINAEGRVNSINKAVLSEVVPAWEFLFKLSTNLGYNLSSAKLQIKDKKIKLKGPADKIYLINIDKSTKGAGEFGFVANYSKFRTSIYSGYGEGAKLAQSQSLLHINKEDADSLGLKDDDFAKVSIDSGFVLLPVKVDEKMPKSVISGQLWFENANLYNITGSFNNYARVSLTKSEKGA
ncbi:MAG TPA: 2Fe-2S iron-sulfur cluster binding domain-containing protein [Desulfurella acetivorans]|uniref:2Fe-2S iron-sulfur cluster binding domain-containing protein n=1 Tax=Desulfurella acetivorans TaxID=33002 RepID=A0A7C6EAU3_DESAE|nr:2Fe-2S iron-sulfur cluster binding domain-containing protein [Desulfurella acetivorans]